MPAPKIAVVSSTERYRNLAGTEPCDGESVLEIGCSSGEATRRMAKRAARVVAVDVSAELVGRLRQEVAELSHVEVDVVDGRDIAAMRSRIESPDLIFIDIGGNALLPNVVSILRGCLQAFHPRLVVVRSFELAELASSIDSIEPPGERDRADLGDIGHLLELSHSFLAADRAFAARRLAAIQTPIALERLSQMVADPERRVRWSARKALEGSGQPPSGDAE